MGAKQAARNDFRDAVTQRVSDQPPSLCSVDLQQQIMTIVDELGKASAKVRGTSRRRKGKRVADQGPYKVCFHLCRLSTSLHPSPAL